MNWNLDGPITLTALVSVGRVGMSDERSGKSGKWCEKTAILTVYFFA